MADTSERRVFCNTILLKYHVTDTYLRDTDVVKMTVRKKRIFGECVQTL